MLQKSLKCGCCLLWVQQFWWVTADESKSIYLEKKNTNAQTQSGHRARHTQLCTNLHHYPGWLPLASHQTEKKINIQTRKDSAVRYTDTTQNTNNWIHKYMTACGTKYTENTLNNNGKFIEWPCTKLLKLLILFRTQLCYIQHDWEASMCNICVWQCVTDMYVILQQSLNIKWFLSTGWHLRSPLL